MKYLLIPIFIIITSCSISKKSLLFENIKPNTEKREYKRILSIAMGKIPTRIFLENLNETLRKKFNSQNIQMEYFFLGSDRVTAIKTFESIPNKNSFDGLMVFIQNSDSFLDIINTTYDIGDSQFGYFKVSAQKIKFSQQFSIQLYDMKNLDASIWESSLGTSYDFTKVGLYDIVSDRIIEDLKLNRLLKL